jgi:hypothetical protein
MRGPLLVALLVSVVAFPSLAATHHVPGDFSNIPAAMDAAAYGDSIIVACAESYSNEIITMKSGVSLLSETGEPECAELKSWPNFCWTVIYCDGCDNTTRIEGFTINFRARDGGCVHLDHSSPTFANCIFTVGGSGFYHVYAEHGSPVFEDCVFRYGYQSIHGSYLNAFTATRCIFEEIGYGWAEVCIGLDADTTTFEDCIFRNNGGHDCETYLLALTCTECSLIGCTFHDNLTECEYGGPVVLVGAYETTIIENCTFAHNRAFWGVIHIHRGTAVLSNTLIAFNTGNAEAVGCDNDAEVYPSCCDIYGNEGGDWVGCIEGLEGIDGNISLDPIFCGDENPEAPLSIRTDSPCAPFTPPNPECDLIGAWPVGCEFMTVEEDVAEQLHQISLSPCEPNPGGDSFRIRYAIPKLRAEDPVRLELFDSSGRLVRALVIGDATPGSHTVIWDGRDGRGRKVPAGIYTYRLEVGGESMAQRLVVIR